jgi:ADP-ribose pyrophosphatase YjhB (NUDIX family)
MVKLASQKNDLRRGVDHIGVTVCFIVHNGKGNVLLQKRSKNTRDEQGNWDIGGGALEFGESIKDAVAREVFEELCDKPTKIEFLEVGEAHRHNGSEPTHWIWLLHAVKVDPSKVKIGEPERIDEIGWFNSENLPSPSHSQLLTAIKTGKSRGIIK